MTKEELIAALRSSGEQAEKALSVFPASGYEEGRYENGWNARQILAHMASIEWTYPRLIEMAKGAPAERTPVPPAPPQSSPMQSGSPQILSYNDRQVAKREGVPVAELIAEFKKNRSATIAAVERTDEALFSREVTSAGGANGTLADVLNFVAVQHVLAHLRDITGTIA
jgi:hypothetical protein